jgi:AcrR family transcriptional regulator
MKDVAAEAGYAVGTLYDYFPDKRALFSGYVRYTLDDMLSRIDREVIARRRRRLAHALASPGGDHVRRR